VEVSLFTATLKPQKGPVSAVERSQASERSDERHNSHDNDEHLVIIALNSSWPQYGPSRTNRSDSLHIIQAVDFKKCALWNTLAFRSCSSVVGSLGEG
jgi:hypothetical protein